MTLRPSHLPRVRRQTLRHLQDPASSIRSMTGDGNRPGLDHLERHLRAADLYWVAPDMAALSVHAGGELAATTWTVADRPSGCGLLWWGGGVHHLDLGRGVQAPVDAVSWGPCPEGVVVWVFIDRWRVEEALRIQGSELVPDGVPPLVPMLGNVLSVETEPLPVAELAARQGPDGIPASLLMTLAAGWALMQQPTLVERTREVAGKAEARSAARAGLPAPEYSRVDLRRQYVPQDREPDAGSDGSRYRHRWVVSGHWRTYRSDRYSEETRASKQWIPAHPKGPAGAPMLLTEKVNVWRR